MIKKITYTIISLIILFAFSNIGWTQNKDSTQKTIKPAMMKKDSIANKKSPKKNQTSDKKLTGFLDKNANGVDDRLEEGKRKGKGKQTKRRDIFIDSNGDGICDGRESAIGLKKTQRMRRGRKP